ncbi:MATE family efflux transporter [Marinivivus vitaminiproducens]|uniref:MATE family efflux transporter n=1 Tax=Marinivivus vitaminiproducens TaxID=3035935 RepID=UPI00279B0F9F|nr:MATE family efflux transporter [Geminicoccaceae bacterium SCSIO 64248]
MPHASGSAMSVAADRSAPRNRTLFQLSFPLFLHSVLTTGVVLIDTMIISAHSAAAAAAVNIANQVLLVGYEFTTLLGVGGLILIAHSLGRGDEATARNVAAIAVLANAALGVLIGVLLALIGPLMLRWLNTPDAIAGEARLYIYVVAVAMAFNGFMVAAIACLRGFGRSRTVLALGLGAYAFYLALEYALILGWGPIPALGVLGSALGTLLMRVAAAGALAVVLVRALGVNVLRRIGRDGWGVIRRAFALAFPSVSDNIAYGLYQLILLGFVAGFGVASVLSRGYVMIGAAFLTLVIMAISQGNEVLLGYHRGAGRTEDAGRQALRSALLAASLATALATVLYGLTEPFIGLFIDDPAVVDISRDLLLLTIILQPGYAVNAILFHSLKAVGDVRWPACVSQAITWGLSLPLAWLFCVHLGHGAPGIWWALIIEETIKALLMYMRWQSGVWSGRAVP